MFYILFILLGAAFGSFFNVCISRIPKKKSLLPPSHCTNCNYKIKFYHNIPVISYLILKGKCKNCGEKIHIHYFLVELFTIILFVGLYAKFGLSFLLLKYLVFFSFAVIIFTIDLFHQIIPDILSLPLIPIGIAFSFFKVSDISWKDSLLGMAFGFILFFIVAVIFQVVKKKESLGGGDIKLIAGIGSFLGIFGSIFTIILGSILGIIILLLIRHNKSEYFPFGPFLLLAAAVYVILGDFLSACYFGLFI